MYNGLLVCHSLFRWFVLISLLLAIGKGGWSWMKNQSFTSLDNRLRHWTATIAHIQLLLGIALYTQSPIIRYFFNNFATAVKEREIRFFGMEHSLMMILAIFIITIGSMKAKRKTTDKAKFKTMTLWYLFGFLLIVLSIPWEFSTFVSRPYFRF